MVKCQNKLYCSSNHSNKLVRDQRFWTRHTKIKNSELYCILEKDDLLRKEIHSHYDNPFSDQATFGAHSNGAVASNYASGTSYVTGETETI